MSGGLARDLFLKELRARIGEKWGLLPDGDAAGFPLLFFVRRTAGPYLQSVSPLKKEKREAAAQRRQGYNVSEKQSFLLETTARMV